MIGLLAWLACQSPSERAWDHLAEGDFDGALADARQVQGPPAPELLRALATWTLQNASTGLDLATGGTGELVPTLEALLAVEHPLREPTLLRVFDELDAQVADAERGERPAREAARSLRSEVLARVWRDGPRDLRPTLEARYGTPPPLNEPDPDPDPRQRLALRLARTPDPSAQATLVELRADPATRSLAWIGLVRLGEAQGLGQAYLDQPSLPLAVLVLEGH